MNILISTLTLLVLVAPSIIFAQTPTPTSLINLPVSPQPGAGGFSGYINLLYGLSISVAALLAVIKIIIAGVKYMLTDVVTSKGEAIKEIKGALLGLLLIIGAVLILIVINPKLLDATLKFNPQPMPNVTVQQPPVRTTSTPPAPAPTPNSTPTTNPNPTPTPQANSSCTPTITSSVQGIYTKFEQNLTGCTPAEKTTYRQSIVTHCRGYNTNATGDGTVSSCLVETTRL